MTVSVIIPSRNRPEVLQDCLTSLQQQSLPAGQFEIILVDNSADGELEAFASEWRAAHRLRYVHEPSPGLHVGRASGCRHASSELLVFCDDDIIAAPGWLEAMQAGLSRPQVAMMGGNNHPEFAEPPPAWLQRWWEMPAAGGRALGHLSILDFGQGQGPIDPAYIWGCNFGIRREVLEAAGGFHPDALPGHMIRYRGDGETAVSEYVRDAGLLAWFDSAASVRHRVPGERMNPDYLARRSFAQGVSDSYTDSRRAGRPPSARECARQLWRQLRGVLACARRAGADATGRQLTRIRLHLGLAHLRGYAFHRHELRQDPELLRWVLRERYP